MTSNQNILNIASPLEVDDDIGLVDEVPEIQAVIPDTKKPALIRTVRDPAFKYRPTRAMGRGSFSPSEYNLSETGRIEDTDSYVRQAHDKKVALMFKEGYDFVGKNLKTIRYIQARLAQIERASKKPTRLLMRDIGSSLIRKSNAFLIKVRKTEASGGRLRTEPGSVRPLKPVAAYFVAPAETMHFELNGNKITKWRQKMPNGEYRDYNPRDIIHFHYDKKDGFIFGTPTLVPVIDDIRALRKIEENVELLVYQHLFPLFHYKVGTENAPAGITEQGELEIDVVKREIQYMPSEGGIVTPERHEIEAIGAQGRALQAEKYMEHFKKRVFSGLGVSAVDMGEGETANRATADNMSRNLIDSVKDFQQVMEAFVDFEIVNELLLESTFGVNVLDEENIVHMRFKQIDIDAKIKMEAHVADQFAKDVIHHDEARREIGKEPWPIPTKEEMEKDEDLAQKYPEWFRSRWELFEKPKLLMQALDEPFSPAAKAVAKNNMLEPSASDMDEVGKKKNEQEVSLEKERTKAKVAVAKATPRPKATTRKDGVLQATFNQLTEDVVHKVNLEQTLEHDWVGQIVRAELNTTIQTLIADQVLAFRSGYSQADSVLTQNFLDTLASARNRFDERANHFVTRLSNHVIAGLKRKVTIDTELQDVASQTRAVFDALKYRTAFIEDVEVRKAWNLGYLKGLKSRKVEEVYVVSSEDGCATCRSHHKEALETALVTLDTIPPFHASCGCQMTLELPETQLNDEVDSPQEESDVNIETESGEDSQSDFRKCSIRTRARLKAQHSDWDDDQLDVAAELACSHHLEDGVVVDGKKESCVKKVKARLRKKNPSMSESDIKSRAFAICTAQTKGN